MGFNRGLMGPPRMGCGLGWALRNATRRVIFTIYLSLSLFRPDLLSNLPHKLRLSHHMIPGYSIAAAMAGTAGSQKADRGPPSQSTGTIRNIPCRSVNSGYRINRYGGLLHSGYRKLCC